MVHKGDLLHAWNVGGGGGWFRSKRPRMRQAGAFCLSVVEIKLALPVFWAETNL